MVRIFFKCRIKLACLPYTWPLIYVAVDTVQGPSVTAFRGHGGSVYLRCFVEFHNVVRTNANVTWYDGANKRMPLVSATAMSATVKSPTCQSGTRRRRRRGGRARRTEEGSEKVSEKGSEEGAGDGSEEGSEEGSEKGSEEGAGSVEYKCVVTWDRSRPYIPEQVYRDFLTLATSKYRPSLELCVATDACANSESTHRIVM